MAEATRHVDPKKNHETRGADSTHETLGKKSVSINHPMAAIHNAVGNQGVKRMVRSGVLQAKLKLGKSHDAFEREADSVADRVMTMPEPAMQRQPEEEKEELIQQKDNAAGNTLQASPDVIQRVDTYGGEWDTTDYSPTFAGNATAGDAVGAHIRLTFMPKELTVTDTQDAIGITQSVRTMCNTVAGGPVNSPSYVNPRNQNLSLTAAEGDEGRAIDQGDSGDPNVANTNPLYAVENTTGNVSATLTDVGAGGGFGQHGHRVRQPDGTFDEQEAILDDTPGRTLAFNGQEWNQKFEATALVLSGPMANTYLGSVEWGWTVNAAGDNEVDPDPIRVISMGTPTGDFMDSAEKWNDATLNQAGTDFDTVDLPLTTHATADPASLNDRQLHTRIRQLTDRIATMRRDPNQAVDYQNIRFEARGLAQEARRRGADVADSGHTYRVRQGDTLWDIARDQLGNPMRWTSIFALNAADTLDPNLIYPGNELRMPTPYRP